MGVGRRSGVVVGALGVAMVVLLALPLGVLFLLQRVERSVAGPCGRDNPVSPRAVLDRAEIGEYEAANLRLLARLDDVFGSHGAPTRGLAHRCPMNTDQGGVVGVTTGVRYEVPAGMTRCDVVRAIEGALRPDGWQVWSIETFVAGTGYAGSTDAWRDRAHLTASVQVDRRSMEVTIDHAGEQPAPVLPPDLRPPCHD